MGALDHKAARGPSQPIGCRSTRDVYSQMMLYRSRSPSPSRGKNELSLFRGQAAKKGKSSVVSVVMARMAYKLERETLDRKLAVLGAEDPWTIDLMIDISISWYAQGMFGEAEALEVKIVDLRRKNLGPSHIATLNAMGNVALTWQEQGRYKESEAAQLQVYNQRLAASCDEDLETLSTLLVLAGVWRSLGRNIEAEHAQRKVVEARVEALGSRHSLSLGGTLELAYTLSRLGRLEEAEEAQVQVLEVSRAVMEPNNRDVSAAMSDLALTWHFQGRYDEAESMQRQAVELKQEVLGPNHPETLSTMHYLALTWHELERYEESEDLISEVVHLRKEVLGELHPDTMESINREAYMQRRRQEREACAELNLLSTSLFPSPHSFDDTLTTRHLERMFSEDEALEARTFEMPDEVSGPTTPNMTSSTALLSSLQHDSPRVYEIFDEEEDDQGGAELGRKGKAAMLPYAEQGAEEACEDEGGENGKETLKGVECWKEAEEMGIETEGEDMSEAAEATILQDYHHVPQPEEDDGPSEKARRDKTPPPTQQVSTFHDEIQSPQSGENDDSLKGESIDETIFTAQKPSTVHEKPEAGEIDDIFKARRLGETAPSTPQDLAMHEDLPAPEAGENDD